MATRWGIASAGLISRDFSLALGTLPKTEHEIVAVAARNFRRASEFAKELNIPKAYGSYEELAQDPEVDIVYIGSINTEHLRMGKLFLEAGKPILCEKPLCMNKRDAEELIELAESKNLFLMEAIWSRFNPLYIKVKEAIAAGEIGEVLNVQVNFGVPIAHKERVSKKNLGGSAILDIGIYTIQFATMILGKPDEIKAFGTVNKDGVDESANAIFTYKNGKAALLAIHTHGEYDNCARIYGKKGSILVESPFWCPTKVKINNHEHSIQVPTAAGEFRYGNSALLRYEAMEVRKCLLKNKLQSPLLTWSESLHIAEIEDEIRKQVGSSWFLEGFGEFAISTNVK